MAKRSLQASQEGARIARKAFDRKGWTQENLAAELELKTRQPIWRFFTCRPVERHIFVELCHVLDLNWWEIADHPPEFLIETVKEQQELSLLAPEIASPVCQARTESSINLQVRQLRESCRDWIENQCGVLRILDTNSPVCFDALYVPVDVVQAFGRFARSETSSFQSQPKHELRSVKGSSSQGLVDTERGFRIPAVQAVQQQQKLRVLGKPGSGKTSLLKYFALRCIREESGTDKVPILIHLDSFATYSQEAGKCNLLDFICWELASIGITNTQVVATLLTEGRFLLLLDALDEVLEPLSYAVYKELTHFTERYYKNQFVIAARLASDRFEFAQFTDVEIADFTDEQLNALAAKWFKVFSKAPELEGQLNAAQFLRQLRLAENQSIHTLARLPLLFNSIAQLFQESGRLSTHHVDIYKTCLTLLLERWDRSRGINRSLAQPDVPVALKQSVLMQLAMIGWQQHRFRFERREIFQWIEKYLHQLYPHGTTSAVLQSTSQAVFAALEHHHGLLVEETQGVFSFSFHGFQSYFAAQWIVSSENLDNGIAILADHIPDFQWYEVVLLSCALSPESNRIINAIKRTRDRLITEHSVMASFIDWTQQIRLKSSTYELLYASCIHWRLIIRTPALLERYASTLAVFYALSQQLLLEVLFDSLLKNIFLFNEDLSRLEKVADLIERAITLSSWIGYEYEFQQLRSLQQNLPSLSQSYVQLRDWWQIFYPKWVEQAQQFLADWYGDECRHLTAEHQQLLRRYAYLSQLLEDCSNLHSTRQSDSDSRSFPQMMNNLINTCPACMQKVLPSINLEKAHHTPTRKPGDRVEEIGISLQSI